MSKNDNVVLGIQYGSEESILKKKKKKEGKKKCVLLYQSKGEPRLREEKQFILNRCNQQWILSSDELSKSILAHV